MSSDLTFITNEPGRSLRDRFGALLGDDTRLFDCLVGYFFISGFHKLHPALTNDEHNPGSWPNVFRDFGVRGFLCESLGKLESLLDRDLILNKR